MNKKNYLLLFLIFHVSFTFAQSEFTERVELGMSLFSITNEKESDRINNNYRSAYGGIFNGFIFKYHKERYTFRLHLRVIGVQGSEMRSSNNPDLGNNYEDVGFQLGAGLEKVIGKKRWQWYMGGELFFLRAKEASFYSGRPKFNSSYNAYSMGGLNLINGIKLKASRHLSFIWEMDQVVGVLTQKNKISNKRVWKGQGYFNPAGIFGVTISWNKQN